MTDPSVEERLSDDLGFDVAAVEQHARFGIDLARMQRGETGTLGYLLLDRSGLHGVAVVFETPAAAHDALNGNHPTVDSLIQEGRAAIAHVPNEVRIADLAGREIILPA